MFNLVEVQTALQSPSVQLADLMKYANGSSAEVPAYLALGELNRRKQLEATNTAFNAKPPTVKDQLTNAPPAVNPTAAPQGIAPTGAPQLASAVAAPPRMNVAAAPANQVNPIAPPQMAAEGGLLSIPTPHMFKQESYANGGIVAFEEGGKTDKYPPLSREQQARRDELEYIKYLDEAKVAKDKPDMETFKRGISQTTDEFNTLRAQRQFMEENPEAAKRMSASKAAEELRLYGATRNGSGYATGGIVAFSGTDDSFVDPKLVGRPTFMDKLTGKAKDKQEKFDKQSKMLAADFSGNASDLELPANAPPHPYSIEKFLNDEQRAARRKVEGTDVNHPSPVNPAEDKRQALLKAKAEQAAVDKARHDALVAQIPTWHTGSDGTIKGTKPVDAAAPVDAAHVAAPAAKAGVASLPHNKPVDDFNSRPAAGIPTAAPAVLPPVTVERDARQDYKALTADERQAAILQQADYDQALREKYGISNDPHKDTRERMDKLEAKRAAQEAEDPFNSLMARLAAYGSSKEQTFGGGMGDSAIAGAKLSKETAALRDKQATEMIAARQAMETAEDARKRGDLTAVKAAEESAEKHTEKAAELGNQSDTALAALTQAQTSEKYHGILGDIATKKAPFENAHTEAETYRIMHPLATPEQVKDHHIKLIKQEYSKTHGGKKMSELDALAAYSDAVNPSRGDTVEQKRQAAFSAAKLMDPTLTYPKYLAQFDTPPDSGKIAAGRAAMKP